MDVQSLKAILKVENMASGEDWEWPENTIRLQALRNEIAKKEKGAASKTKNTDSEASKRKTTGEKKSSSDATLVEHHSQEVKLFKRYLALHAKTKKVKELLPLIKSLQKAILEKFVDKKSPHARLIEVMQENLVGIYNKYEPNQSLKIELEERSLPAYIKAVGGEAVYKSIYLIRRFISMTGKKLVPEQLQKYLTSIDAQKISEDDPFAPKLKEIIAITKQMIKDKEPSMLPRQELRGLEGLLKKCGCKQPKEIGTIYSHPKKGTRQCKSRKFSDADSGACSWNKGLKHPKKGLGATPSISAQEAMSKEYSPIPFSGKWAGLFGTPCRFKMMIHGGPGSGKSSLLLEFAHYLATRQGPVLYVSSEEYDTPTMQLKLNTLPNIPPDLRLVSADLKGEDLTRYKFIFLDSVNHMKLPLEEFVRMNKTCPQTSFIYILQHTKDGKFRGGMDWEHEADIAASVNQYKITVYKNRYGVKGELNFYDESKIMQPQGLMNQNNSEFLNY